LPRLNRLGKVNSAGKQINTSSDYTAVNSCELNLTGRDFILGKVEMYVENRKADEGSEEVLQMYTAHFSQYQVSSAMLRRWNCYPMLKIK